MATGGKKETGLNLINIGTLALGTDDLHPRGVVVVGDKLVITDSKSKKVRVFSRHDGTLLSSSDGLESIPCGLCRVNDTDLCVVMWDGIITLMSVQDSGLISRGKTFHLKPSFDDCHGVALFRDNVVVSGVKDNMICWCVVSLKDGRHDDLHKVCGGTLSFLTTKSNMVFISCDAYSYDDNHGVYGFNLLNPRQQPYRYKYNKGWPRGITVDDKGDLFVCYYYSIHHLTSTCQLVDIYTEGIPSHPGGPCYIFWDSGILYVASLWSNVIYMYRTPHQAPAISAQPTTKVDTEDQKKKRQLVIGGARAVEQAEVSQKRKIYSVKQEARIPPLNPVLKVDPVEQVTQALSETGIHGSILRRLSKDLICDDWRFFFRELSVTDREIRQIEIDYRHDGVREQIYQLLCRSNEKGILNKTSIIEALKNIDRDDLVTRYKQEKFHDS